MDLSVYDVVAILLDGKTFGDDEMVIALGVTLGGQKVVLGFLQTATKNERVCSAFLRRLLDRGLWIDQGVLCVIDGAKRNPLSRFNNTFCMPNTPTRFSASLGSLLHRRA